MTTDLLYQTIPVAITHQTYPDLLKSFSIEKLKQDLATSLECYAQASDGFVEFYRRRAKIIQAELAKREERQ